MPEATPLPVELVGLGPDIYAYLDKAEDAYRLAFYFGALAAFVALILMAGILVAVGLRRYG